MNRARKPDSGLTGYQSALDLTARVAAAVLAMVGPGLGGQWLDQRWGTGFLALLGFLFGIPFGIYYLLVTSRSVSRKKSPSPLPPTSPDTIHPPPDDHERPLPSDE